MASLDKKRCNEVFARVLYVSTRREFDCSTVASRDACASIFNVRVTLGVLFNKRGAELSRLETRDRPPMVRLASIT
jgi:hypothetical protein